MVLTTQEAKCFIDLIPFLSQEMYICIRWYSSVKNPTFLDRFLRGPCAGSGASKDIPTPFSPFADAHPALGEGLQQHDIGSRTAQGRCETSCRKFRETLSYEREDTSAECFSINSSFTGIWAGSVHAHLIRKYDGDFLEKVKRGKNFVIRQSGGSKESLIFHEALGPILVQEEACQPL